jgi:hypothetical protein
MEQGQEIRGLARSLFPNHPASAHSTVAARSGVIYDWHTSPSSPDGGRGF